MMFFPIYLGNLLVLLQNRFYNTPEEGEDIISACDKLAVSLEAAIANAQDVIRILKEMKKINPPL